MDFLTVLRGKVAELIAERDAAKAELDATLSVPSAEARDLNADESAAFEAARAKIADVDARLDEKRARIAELEAIEARQAAEAAVRPTSTLPAGESVVRSEERTYSKGSERRGISFIADVVNGTIGGDFGAQQRLNRHRTEERIEWGDQIESRAAGDALTSAFAGLTVPQYLTDMAAPLARAGRPFADICNSHPLPADGMTVNISRITTGVTAAAQATELAAVSSTSIDDTLLTVDVRTYAGQQTLSRQAVERSTGADSIVLSDLMRAYHTALDSAIINGDGNSGVHLGVRNVSGNAASTYTDASPTAAECWPKLFDLVSQIQAGVFLGVSHFVMHPRRFWWLVSQVGTTFPFIQVAGIERGGTVDSRDYENGPSGFLGGIPVIVDANIPTNLGGGTEDTIIAVVASECHLWEDQGPLMIRAEQTAAASLGVLLVVYGFSAFTAGRYPLATGDVTGTGLAAPTFA
jgi:HK97 family phage major capsid protein